MAYDPATIDYTAVCPGCGADAAWVAYVPGSPFQPTRYHVDCAGCGPCPCDNHDAQEVAA